MTNVKRHLFLYGSTLIKEGGTYAERTAKAPKPQQRCKGGAAKGVTHG